jgi:hypothetical protein
MYSNQNTHEDISNQISRESPWAEDKPQIEEEIHQLQQEIALLKTQLTTHEVTDKIRYSQRKK